MNLTECLRSWEKRHGDDVVISDGAQDWDIDNLLDATADDDNEYGFDEWGHICSVSADGYLARQMYKIKKDDNGNVLTWSKLRSTAAAALGKKGGSAKTEKKAASSRENGKKGGRPKKGGR